MTSVRELLATPRDDLLRRALELGGELRPHLNTDELAAAVLTAHLGRGDPIEADGVLTVLPEGFGFLRAIELGYEPSAVDTYVSPSQIRSLNLQQGHRVQGPVRAPRSGERFFALLHVDAVEGQPPEHLDRIAPFDARTPMVATRPLSLGDDDDELWALQTLAPWCFGHRVLLRAPESFARGHLLARLARSVQRRHPEVRTTICLLDQRPEDGAAVRARLDGSGIEVVDTPFAAAPDRHVATATLVAERARRQAEHGHDVLLLLDSLTALTRAEARTSAPSGAWVQPGLDARALLTPKRWFACARQLAGAGSVTIVATVLPGEPGSIDATVASEFAPHSNSDVVIAPELATAEVALPFDPARTRTRTEDDPIPADERRRRRALQEQLLALPPDERLDHLLRARRDQPR